MSKLNHKNIRAKIRAIDLAVEQIVRDRVSWHDLHTDYSDWKDKENVIELYFRSGLQGSQPTIML